MVNEVEQKLPKSKDLVGISWTEDTVGTQWSLAAELMACTNAVPWSLIDKRMSPQQGEHERSPENLIPILAGQALRYTWEMGVKCWTVSSKSYSGDFFN